MPLLRLDAVHLHYGTQALLDGVDLQIRRGDRIGLLGRNGAGKTSLLKIIAGETQAEDGERWVRPDITIARLEQTLPASEDQDVYDAVASGLAATGELLSQYHHMVQADPPADLDELARVQQQLEAADGWQLQQRVETTLSQLELDGDSKLSALSGGWRRRVALARALVSEPDLLLLDEPTNHLDIPAIEWLEEHLGAFNGAIVLITHDRRFLQNVTNTIAELDRGRLTIWQGDYRGFLKHREQELAAQEKANALFDKQLAQEEVWIRKGIKARRTRNEGRVRALKAMRRERQQRREQTGTARINLEDAGQSGKIVATAEHVSKRFDSEPVIEDFSTIIQRGDRIGIVGPNGAGKSTLVKLLLGQLDPDGGKVTPGTRLQIAYADQTRDTLDLNRNLIDNICGGREFIEIDGRQRHAISYLGDFLFTPERIRTPVKVLSGGEQNRAVLAKLFSQPANLLVLDEPTNDLDIETLELLEELLLNFQGTVLLVSHDRDFMDNVVTSLLVFEGNGVITEHAGGYSEWEARGNKLGVARQQAPGPAKRNSDNESPPTAEAEKKSRKLSYKEQRELEQLPQQIEKLEATQSALEEKISDPGFYDGERETIDATLSELSELQQQLEAAYERWAELENDSR